MEKSKKHGDKLKLLESKSDLDRIGPVRTSLFGNDFMIGEGSFGTCVFLGIDDDDNPVAVKRILTQTAARVKSVENEVKLLDQLKLKRSEHIVTYRHFLTVEYFSYIVLDLCEETLADYVEGNNKEYLERRGPTIIQQILTGLHALHSGEIRILHMDLKPENILVDHKGHMRLADFGLSRILGKNQTTLLTGSKGTPGWMAVESLPRQDQSGKKARFKRKSDIQVAGMISFYVLTKGGHPFGDINHRTGNIKDGKPVDLEKLTNSLARKFVSWLIEHDTKKRPYAEEALGHSYLQPNSVPAKRSNQDETSDEDNSDIRPGKRPKQKETSDEAKNNATNGGVQVLPWTGYLEWHETVRPESNGPMTRVNRTLACHVSTPPGNNLQTDTWPEKLVMQLIPQTLLTSLGTLLHNSRTVYFHFAENDTGSLRALHRVMATGVRLAGCVHFVNATDCDVRILLLIFSPRKREFVGLIPNDQPKFLDTITKVIGDHKKTQLQVAQIRQRQKQRLQQLQQLQQQEQQ